MLAGDDIVLSLVRLAASFPLSFMRALAFGDRSCRSAGQTTVASLTTLKTRMNELRSLGPRVWSARAARHFCAEPFTEAVAYEVLVSDVLGTFL